MLNFNQKKVYKGHETTVAEVSSLRYCYCQYCR